MSLPDRDHPSSGLRRLGAIAGLALALAASAGCTVRPLYGDVTSATGGGRSASAQSLASVEVKPASDRVGQEVRNHLIFMLAGGAGQPANPAYSVNLRTTARIASAAVVQTSSSTDLEPTSAVVTVSSAYALSDAEGVQISAGTRSAQAAYDVSRQGFAALRAQRDAQNRAARELAEQLRLAIAQDLERPSSTASPAIITAPEQVDGLPADEEVNLPAQ